MWPASFSAVCRGAFPLDFCSSETIMVGGEKDLACVQQVIESWRRGRGGRMRPMLIDGTDVRYFWRGCVRVQCGGAREEEGVISRRS